MVRVAREGLPTHAPEEFGMFELWRKNGRDFGRPIKTEEGFLDHVRRAKLEFREFSKNNLHPIQIEVLEEVGCGGTNAILFGEPTKGKTAVALMALKKLHMAGNSIMIRRWSDGIRMPMLRDAMEAERILYGSFVDNLAAPKYLLIDELGMGNAKREATNYECQCLLDIINARQSRRGYTIITTNLSLEQFEAAYGRPTFSRLQQGGQRYTKHFDSTMPDYRI